VRRHLTEDQVEALEIELSDALARTLDEIKDSIDTSILERRVRALDENRVKRQSRAPA
jgi:hypothetical protein